MTELLTAAQMRAIEEAAIASGEVTGLELMERAGRGVVEAIFAEWPELGPAPGALPRTPGYLETDEMRWSEGTEAPLRAVVLCGPGNNGGDGFVVARILKGWGWEVEVFLYGDPDRMPPDARVNYERWLGMGEVMPLTSPKFEKADLVVDAIFGLGLSRGFEVPRMLDIEYHRFMTDGLWWTGERRRPYIVAVDVVSELDADSGRVLDSPQEWGGEMGAHLTVTFHAPKLGHYLDASPAIGGGLRVVDLGIKPPPVEGHLAQQARERVVVDLLEGNLLGASLTKASPEPYEQHKFIHGHALILSGPSGRGGAARLAARGALRIGAGLVTVVCPPEALTENAARLDAVMLREVAEAGGLTTLLADKRINALCLGPGLGTGAREAALILAALEVARPVVLDADALRAGFFDEADALFSKLHGKCVLTPHGGEFARLFPDVAAKLAAPATTGPAYSKVDATREAARRAGAVVLFKGPDTVIAAPDGRCAINSAAYERAAPWLATAGSGDVLAGFITGLLARGFTPFDAACTGAWLHVESARSFGPGLIAEDLPEELPKVFRALGL